MDVVLFKLTLVKDSVVAVAGKAVQLPDQDCIENFPGTVLDHPLELGTVVGLGGVGPVDVGAHDGDTVKAAAFFENQRWKSFTKSDKQVSTCGHNFKI